MSIKRTLLIQFRVDGDLCALSHRETLTLWQRVLIRCRLPLRYSRGFNPRPGVSLPLPRAVGLCSDGELLSAELEGPAEFCAEAFGRQLNGMLPSGCAVTGVEVVEGSRRLHAVQVDYLMERSEGVEVRRWEACVERCSRQLAGGEPIVIERNTPKHKKRPVNLRDYVEAVTGNRDTLRLRCRVDSSGSVRVEELLGWLEIGPRDLARPPHRTGVVWIQN